MTLINQSYKIIATLLFVTMAFQINTVSAQEYIPKPEYSYVDSNNVDVLGGKLTLTTPGVSIGSESLGLSYNVSSYSGDFINAKDDFNAAEIYFARKAYKDGTYKYIRYMIVRSPAGTARFTLDGNDNYIGMDNSQSSVVEQGNNFTITYPDGSIAVFSRTSNENLTDWPQHTDPVTIQNLIQSGAGYQETKVAQLEELTFPNGYTLTLHRLEGAHPVHVTSVTTNTGLQIKYTDWQQNASSRYTYVYAINNAISYCSPSLAESCNFQGWPSVKLELSDPNALQNVFNHNPIPFSYKATDAAGLTTEYLHTPYDDHVGASNNLYPLGESFTWRISEITQPSGRTTNYTYSNRADACPASIGSCIRVVERSVLRTASTDTHTTNYFLDSNIPGITPYSDEWVKHTANGYRGSSLIYFGAKGTLVVATDYSAYETYIFANNWNNEVTTVSSPQGTFKYYYDDKKHLTKRTHVIGSSESAPENIDLIAVYPTSCSNPKTCNKPIQYIDGKGNVTDFEYHPQSGQIAKVTKPAGRNGVRPQTRYTYEQKYAWYKDSSGSLKRATKPVWLLTNESTCQKGAASGNGCASANDEVITSYDYGPDSGPNNLFLRGLAVTANGVTRRTCYEYDHYGNRISETRPKGTTTSCL